LRSCRRRRQNNVKDITAAINISPPIAAPTIAPTDVVLPLEELEVVLVDDGATGEVVAEGDEALMHDESSVVPTVSVSLLPPCRPSESTIMNITVVPFQISAVQS
jgi:hypothetical protein